MGTRQPARFSSTIQRSLHLLPWNKSRWNKLKLHLSSRQETHQPGCAAGVDCKAPHCSHSIHLLHPVPCETTHCHCTEHPPRSHQSNFPALQNLSDHYSSPPHFHIPI